MISTDQPVVSRHSVIAPGGERGIQKMKIDNASIVSKIQVFLLAKIRP